MLAKRALLLAAALSVPFPAEAASLSRVVVRFGSLHWVDARGGTPRLQDSRVIVPFVSACDLLGLTCKAVAEGVRVGKDEGGRLISQRGAGFVELRALLEGHGGFTLTYDGMAHTAVVRTKPNVDMPLTRWMQAQDDWGRQLRLPYQGPLFALKTKTAQGIRYQLSTSGTPLNGVTLLSGFPAGEGANVPSLNVVGALTPSLPDTPNRDPGCGGKSSCSQTIYREGLWTLAAVDAR